MASNENQKNFLVSSGCQTNDKPFQTHFDNENVSPWLNTDNHDSGTVLHVPARSIPVRSVSTYSFRESNKESQINRASPFPSLPSRREVLDVKSQVEQEILRLRADLSSLQHERASFNRSSNVSLLTTSDASTNKELGIHEYRGLVISDNSVNSIIEENRAKKEKSEKTRSLSEFQLFRTPIEFPYYKNAINAQKKNIVPLFAAQFLQKQKIKEHQEELTREYVKVKDAWKRPNELIDEYSSRVDIKSENWPPEFNMDIPKIDDAARLKWCAPDSEMILCQEQKEANCFYDMNGLVESPVASHNEYKARLSWTEEEKNIFIEKYRQYPKDFRKITAALPEKTHKDVIEYYYLKRYEFNLKQSEAAAKKRGGKKKVISEGSAKKNY
ncbi:hypothetical protein M9Y10_043419 [Tritrichomonas musculus]|uniref:SANT domain-containing protein n=1 Tax=Tritrichomonas musculus TaxID=1915356 RepID=A0ABR2K006_9EUKA